MQFVDCYFHARSGVHGQGIINSVKRQSVLTCPVRMGANYRVKRRSGMPFALPQPPQDRTSTLGEKVHDTLTRR